jgi:hypothetical protein
MRRSSGGVRLDDAERVEPRRDRRPAVHRAERPGNAADRLGPANRLRLDHVALQKTGDEVPLGLDERDHLRPDAHGRRCERGFVLDAPVDPEQLRVLASDPEHVGAVIERDLEIAVGDAPAEHLDVRAGARPDSLDHLLDSHGRAMVVPECSQPVSFGTRLTRLG